MNVAQNTQARPSDDVVADAAATQTRRYVPLGKRIVPLSVLLAVVAAAAAVVLAWRLYTPSWAGGVGRIDKAPQPAASKIENAPGPDNSITTLPPPSQRTPPVSNEKKGKGE